MSVKLVWPRRTKHTLSKSSLALYLAYREQQAGIVGLDTAMVSGGWGVSINARGGNGGGPDANLAAAARGAKIAPFMLRQAMDAGAATYDEALAYFSTEEMIKPLYLILVGANAGEGAVISRDADPASDNNDVFKLGEVDFYNPQPWFHA